eukprot:TRINITY_DN872_c0_g1_i2.p1 TRINITY_DN872_c0_g1~~TRINITY_DN872_c0_g1_i2.p1  ORF type:complete len:269 (-),score=40.73 TRINITY_DN872_c0_g1_i2:26-832(-)
MEAINGVKKEVAFTALSECTSCKGSGSQPGTKPLTCKTCKGQGRYNQKKGSLNVSRVCLTCDGTGVLIKHACKTCDGSRVSQQDRLVKVDVPPGVEDGTELRAINEGNVPEGLKGKKGNLFVNIEIEAHPVFQRKGQDLHVFVPISLSQALLGGSIQIPTLKGKVEVKIPSGARPGESRALRGYGIPKVAEDGRLTSGNQYIHFEIQIPEELTESQLERVKEFAKEEVPVRRISSKSNYPKFVADSTAESEQTTHTYDITKKSGWFHL